MTLAPLLVAIFSTLVGALLPSLKELVRDLRKRSRGDEFFKSTVGQALLKALGFDEQPDSPATLFAELGEASKKMDAIVSRIQEYTRARETAVTKLESELGVLTEQEMELRKRIEGLQRVPLPAAEYFVSLISKGEKNSAWRDYILFTAGVIVSALVGIVLKHLGLA
jgi:hypothetical protein